MLDQQELTYDIEIDSNKRIYNFHIHTVLVAKAYVAKQEDTYLIRRMSTINFNTNDNNHHDQLELFVDDQLTYEQSRIWLETNHIPNLWTKIFSDIINNIKDAWGRRVELQAIPTSRWFYDKVCPRLQEQEIIEVFSFNQQNRLVILLNKSEIIKQK